MVSAVEHTDGTSIWEAYLEVMADPGHLLAELTFVLLLDVLFLGLVVPFMHRILKWRLERLHREVDEEHNVDHHQAVSPGAGKRKVGPSAADLAQMREDGVNEWVVLMLQEHYGTRGGGTTKSDGPPEQQP